MASPLTILGVDFTSAPSRRKQITVAVATLFDDRLTVARVDRFAEFPSFEQMLATPGPWVGGFDFPFSMPRELVQQLGWPTAWPQLVAHCARIGRDVFVGALEQVRQSRPYGARYIGRTGDALAGSSSPMKLVNPPVALMFFEGAPRLLHAGLSVVPCAPSADGRVAVEAYPGFFARKVTRDSYKKDGPGGTSPSRRAARRLLIDTLLCNEGLTPGIMLTLPTALRQECIDDGSGDTLDSVICAVQAAVATRQGPTYGVPPAADPLEGWIVTVPGS